jgi:hypothetical protein
VLGSSVSIAHQATLVDQENLMNTWAPLYGTERWRRRARLQLRHFPMCAACERAGRVREANLAHHLEPHRDGDSELRFWYGPLESLCFDCHKRHHGWPAARGFATNIGADGFPTDPMHPFWTSDRRHQQQERQWGSTKQSKQR